MAIQINNTRVNNIVGSVYSARNPMNSWDKSDSDWKTDILGTNDLALAKRLAKAGSDHAKYLRTITVNFDLTAPLYFWKQFDQYKVGVTTNSCSTMHRIHAKEFAPEDFSREHLFACSEDTLNIVITRLNEMRDIYLNGGITDCKNRQMMFLEPKDKDVWWQLIQLLPSSYNQKRSVQANYQVLKNIYFARKNHKLDEWYTLCEWIETLPYFKEICIDSCATKEDKLE